MSGAVVSLDEKVTEDQPLTDGGLNKVWSLDDSLGGEDLLARVGRDAAGMRVDMDGRVRERVSG